jgi:hypothetical protein
VHPRGGLQALDSIGLLRFLFEGLELARGHLSCDSVLAGGN